MSKKAKTPKKSSTSEDVLSPLSPTLSPVVVSPCRSPCTGNLTGNSLKVKDAAADWHNYTERWNFFRNQGAGVIQLISNIKLEAVYSNEGSIDIEDNKEKVQTMPDELEKHTEKLQSIHASMGKLVQKLENITRILKGVCDFEWQQNNDSYPEEPLFKTWQTPRFYEASAELLAMYQKELTFKETVVQNIAHATDRDSIMTLAAGWVHEPYIEEKAEFLLECLLHETGYR